MAKISDGMMLQQLETANDASMIDDGDGERLHNQEEQEEMRATEKQRNKALRIQNPTIHTHTHTHI